MYAVGLVVVLALGIGVGTLATVVYERGLGSSGGAGSQQADNQQGNSSQLSADEYISEVGDIQNRSVDAFTQSNERLLRYDSLTADDVKNISDNYSALSDLSERVKNLNPPDEYESQYGLFSSAVSELYQATGIAYRVTNDPVSATVEDFEAYNGHVDSATTSLQQSNAILGQNFSTTEGSPRPRTRI